MKPNRWMSVLVATIGILAAAAGLFGYTLKDSVIVGLFGKPPESQWDSYSRQLAELSVKLAELENQTQAIQATTKELPAETAAKVAALEKSVDSLSTQTIGLRQAINPTNPEEILTIARLGDQISSISAQQRELSSTVDKQLSVLRQDMQSNLTWMTTFQIGIFTTILPLFFSFVSGGFRSSRNTSREER